MCDRLRNGGQPGFSEGPDGRRHRAWSHCRALGQDDRDARSKADASNFNRYRMILAKDRPRIDVQIVQTGAGPRRAGLRRAGPGR